ncbi:hypothetical protein GCM10023315_23830 [Algibacter aquimarinus]|uniref:Uncharacterized protein n=2 Tax=Algibacter aquimarinus TaxID=1136748 RepID=A0ABP9HJY1_9FLAO
MAAVFLVGGFSNISAESKLIEKTIEEEDGCASDCVQEARDLVLQAAEENEDDIYMETYMALYTICLNQNC